MDKKILKKGNGDIFLEAERKDGNAYIFVNWIGIQSLESIMMGANLLLSMLREKGCAKILNSNRELIGPWDDGAAFLGSKWAPKAKNQGVKVYAQVMAFGNYGQRSFYHFHQFGQTHFQIKAFETEAEAEKWLLAQAV